MIWLCWYSSPFCAICCTLFVFHTNISTYISSTVFPIFFRATISDARAFVPAFLAHLFSHLIAKINTGILLSIYPCANFSWIPFKWDLRRANCEENNKRAIWTKKMRYVVREECARHFNQLRICSDPFIASNFIKIGHTIASQMVNMNTHTHSHPHVPPSQ